MSTGRATILWSRAPFVLRRFPQILGITILAAAILAIATASGPTFLKASESASLRGEIEEKTVWGAGLRASYRSGFIVVFGRRGASDDIRKMKRIESSVATAIGEELQGVPFMGDVTTTLVGAISRVSGSDGDQQEVRLIHRDGALENVKKLEQAEDPDRGIWLSDVTADAMDVEG